MTTNEQSAIEFWIRNSEDWHKECEQLRQLLTELCAAVQKYHDCAIQWGREEANSLTVTVKPMQAQIGEYVVDVDEVKP